MTTNVTEKIWTYQLPNRASVQSSPALAGDTLIFSSATKLYGISLYDGRERFSYQILNPISNIVTAAGKVFFFGNRDDYLSSGSGSDGDSDGDEDQGSDTDEGLIVLDAGSGQFLLNWQQLQPPPGARNPVVDPGSGLLLLSDGYGHVYAYDLQTAEKQWTTQVSDAQSGPAALGDGAVFAVSNGVLYAVNMKSGQVRWKYQPPNGDTLHEMLAPMAGNNMVIVLGLTGLYALDWRTGQEKWTIAGSTSDHWNTPVLSWERDCIFVTTQQQGAVHGYELSTGRQFWQSSLSDLSRRANVPSQSGGFLAPFLNTDAVAALPVDDDVFLPAQSGMVFIVPFTHVPGVGHTVQDTQVSVADHPTGLSFSPAIGNDTMILTDNSGTLSAHSFSPHPTAYFPKGEQGHIQISSAAVPGFGSGDFSIEVWVRTTAGGELLTQSPASAGNGFRLVVANAPGNPGCIDYGEGCIQFSISAPDGSVPLLVQTEPTVIADGTWHHLAVVSSSLGLAIYMDGIGQPVEQLLPLSSSGKTTSSKDPIASDQPLSIDAYVKVPIASDQPMYIGVYRPSSADVADPVAQDFEGLLADVRLWKTALTAKQIQDRMGMLLTGNEPGLVGYWPLNQPSPSDFHDITSQQPASAPNVKSLVSNLALDDGLFPYLLNNVEAHWPYAERWTVRGEDAPVGTAVGSGDVVSFVTDRAIYGVDAVHGNRKWGIDALNPSRPVTDGLSLFVQDGTTVLAIDPETGEPKWQTNLAAQAPASGDASKPVLAPCVTRGAVVCSADGHTVYWLDKTTGALLGYYVASGKVGSDLLAAGDSVYLVDGQTLRRISDPPRGGPAQKLSQAAASSISLGLSPQLALDGGCLFAYDGRTVNLLDATTLQPPPKIAWNPADLGGAGVTGMAASANLNRLFLSTNRGELLLWEYGSGKELHRIALPGLSNGYVFAPVLAGDNVYCTAKGTVNGRSGGGIWAFDAKTGALRGWEPMSAPPVASPFIRVGAAFFGCNDPSSHSRDAQALHVVVFGSATALKREAGDTPLTVAGASVTSVFNRVDDGANCFNAGNFTLEAWINTKVGGEIVSVAPVSGPFAGFCLSLDGQGSISAQHLKVGAGSQFKSKATSAADGRWHHIAAIFKFNTKTNQEVCYLYLDGSPLDGVAYSSISVPNPGGVQDRQVTIGGSANSFQGMIHDVRVWSTWLHAAEINSRRNVTLTGDEPNLLASWNFGTNGVHDDSLNKLDAPNASARFWLTDLTFVSPNYPYLFAKSLPGELVTGTTSTGQTITSATYTTQIFAHQADGTARPNTQLKIWSSEPVQISSDVKPGLVMISGDKPYEITMATGQATLNLSCQDLQHSPALEIWADFMYPNEQFFVSPVIESQRHVYLPPPYLTAQSVMIQDYDYTSGDSLGTPGGNNSYTLNPNVDITTIRTVLTAHESDGSPMPDESLEIWADGNLTIEVDGQKYSINSDNSAKFTTGKDGSVTIVLHEDSNHAPDGHLLNVPTLQVRAGFMPLSSRFVVNPAESCHQTLANVTQDQISGNKPLAPDKPKTRLIKPELDSKADSIVQVLNHVASMVSTSNSSSTSRSSSSAARGRKQAVFLARANAPSDAVQALHSSSYIRYRAPITPEYMPHPHFILSFDDTGHPSSFTPFDTTADLDNHLQNNLKLASSSALFSRAITRTGDDAAGGWFNSLAKDIKKAVKDVGHGLSSAWDDVKHFVVRTWDEVKNDIGEVIHQVEVAIVDVWNNVTTWVIKTVKDALDHIVAFLKKIWVLIKDIYNFLRALFDWGAILDVHDVIRDTTSNTLKQLKAGLDSQVPQDIKNAFSGLKEKIDQALRGTPSGPSLSSYKTQSSGLSGQFISQGKSVKSRYMTDKLKKHATGTRKVPVNPFGVGNVVLPPGSDLEKRAPKLNQVFNQLVSDISVIVNQPGGLTRLSLQEVLNLLDDAIDVVLEIIDDVILGLCYVASVAIDGVIELLEEPIDIPLISDLYKLITGGARLTILDLLSLVAAIPLHLILVVADIPFSKQEAQGFLNNVSPLSSPGLSGNENRAIIAPSHLSVSGGLQFADTAFLMFSVIGGSISGMADFMQGEMNASKPPEGLEEETPRILFLTNLLSNFTSFCTGMFQWGVRTSMSSDGWNAARLSLWTGLVGPAIQLGLGSISVVQRLRGSKEESYGYFKGIPYNPLLSLLGLGLIGYNAYSLVELINNKAPDDELAEASIDIAGKLPLALKFLLWDPVAKATMVDGVSISSLGFALVESTVTAVVTPVVHMSAGYGKEIL
jgi:outer membrane protein assembly factor BamB